LTRSYEDISLLVGFDSMRAYLQSRWLEGEERDDNLAGLLGDLDRNETRNTPPLDLAEWSDWLNAVLSVRPDLDDIRRTLRQIQDDQREFVLALAVEPSEAQVKVLDELRNRAAQHTWHRIGDLPINALSAYEAMRPFLGAYWATKSHPLGKLAAIFDELNNHDAQWAAWLAAVQVAKDQNDRRQPVA
jgi:hypothetical protein